MAARPVRLLCEYEEPRHRFLEQDVRDTIVVFGSARIVPRDVAEARLAFEPVTGKALHDARFAAVGLWLEACEQLPKARALATLDGAIAANRRDFDARFERAMCLLAGNAPVDAMDELLEILMRDKAWSDGRARKAYVSILELLTKPTPKPAAAATGGTLEVAGKSVVASADPLVDQYRRKLSMVLF